MVHTCNPMGGRSRKVTSSTLSLAAQQIQDKTVGWVGLLEPFRQPMTLFCIICVYGDGMYMCTDVPSSFSSSSLLPLLLLFLLKCFRDCWPWSHHPGTGVTGACRHTWVFMHVLRLLCVCTANTLPDDRSPSPSSWHAHIAAEVNSDLLPVTMSFTQSVAACGASVRPCMSWEKPMSSRSWVCAKEGFF